MAIPMGGPGHLFSKPGLGRSLRRTDWAPRTPSPYLCVSLAPPTASSPTWSAWELGTQRTEDGTTIRAVVFPQGLPL